MAASTKDRIPGARPKARSPAPSAQRSASTYVPVAPAPSPGAAVGSALKVMSTERFFALASDVGTRSNFLWMSYSQGAKDAVARLWLEIVGCASAYCIHHITIREKR